MKRALVVCPGRGSYTRDRLGTLGQTPSVAVADRLRRDLRRPTPTELDAAESYQSKLHVAGENASILTAACTLADLDVLKGVEIVGVVGNSMGWYTALAVAGALPLEDGLRLIETMGQYQANNVVGGQLVYPLVDDAWRPLPSPELDDALAEVPGLYVSIRLGGQIVLGGTHAALTAAMQLLPPRKAGDRDAPFQLPLHSAFHTPLMAETAARAQADLAGLAWQAPRFPLVDGQGRMYHAWSASPSEIRDYTLGTQVTEPYHFARGLQVALGELAPDLVLLPGPGSNLGGATAQAMIEVGWKRLRSKADFQELQRAEPYVVAMARPDQRILVT